MLITPEDLDRLARLEIEREGDKDVVWACRLARQLARLKPSEHDFLEYVALMNHNVVNAYLMRHVETVRLERVIDAREGPRFVHEFTCLPVEAFLCVRPYVRLESPKSQELLDQLEKASRFTVYVDKAVLATGALAEILIGLDGYGTLRKPYVLKFPKGSGSSGFFGAGLYSRESMTALFSDIGVFLATQTKIEIALHLPMIIHQDPVKLSIGLVAARYTTKGMGPGPIPVTA